MSSCQLQFISAFMIGVCRGHTYLDNWQVQRGVIQLWGVGKMGRGMHQYVWGSISGHRHWKGWRTWYGISPGQDVPNVCPSIDIQLGEHNDNFGYKPILAFAPPRSLAPKLISPLVDISGLITVLHRHSRCAVTLSIRLYLPDIFCFVINPY